MIFSFSFLYLILFIYLLYPGACKSVYAPEPFDVGRSLEAEIIYDYQLIKLTTTGAIDPGLLLDFLWLIIILKKNLILQVFGILFLLICSNL